MVRVVKIVLRVFLTTTILGIPSIVLLIIGAIVFVAASLDIIVFSGPKRLLVVYREAWRDRRRRPSRSKV